MDNKLILNIKFARELSVIGNYEKSIKYYDISINTLNRLLNMKCKEFSENDIKIV